MSKLGALLSSMECLRWNADLNSTRAEEPNAIDLFSKNEIDFRTRLELVASDEISRNACSMRASGIRNVKASFEVINWLLLEVSGL